MTPSARAPSGRSTGPASAARRAGPGEPGHGEPGRARPAPSGPRPSRSSRPAPTGSTVVALGAHRSVDVLAAQARRLRPEVVAIGDPSLAAELARPAARRDRGGGRAPRGWPPSPRWPTWSSTGWSGFAGLTVTLAALEAGRRLALANKESIIAGAPVVQRARRTPGAEIIPVDSEHCAIHQCLRAGAPTDVARLLLTASGGPFRGREPRASWPRSSVAEALGPSDLVDGPEDHRGLLHPDEQGPRGHRGPRAVRHPLRRHRRGGPSPVDRPLDGRVRRRRRRGPAVHARHAPAHRLRPGLSRTAARSPSGPSTGPSSRRLEFEAARPDRCSPASTSPTGPAGPATWPRPGSTPPTRWRWPPSSPAASRGRPSPRWWRAPSTATTPVAVGRRRRPGPRSARSTTCSRPTPPPAGWPSGWSPAGRRRHEHHRHPAAAADPPARAGRRRPGRPSRSSRPRRLGRRADRGHGGHRGPGRGHRPRPTCSSSSPPSSSS